MSGHEDKPEGPHDQCEREMHEARQEIERRGLAMRDYGATIVAIQQTLLRTGKELEDTKAELARVTAIARDGARSTQLEHEEWLAETGRLRKALCDAVLEKNDARGDADRRHELFVEMQKRYRTPGLLDPKVAEAVEYVEDYRESEKHRGAGALDRVAAKIASESLLDYAEELAAVVRADAAKIGPLAEDLELAQRSAEVSHKQGVLGWKKWSDAINESRLLRKLLWLRHGHDGLYGDDGEMQCGRCGVDFKRQSAAEIDEAFYNAGLRALSEKALAEKERAAQ